MTAWIEQAACKDVDPEMFHDGHLHHRAVHVCLSHCPVIAECREWAHGDRPLPGQVLGGEVWVRHGSLVRVGKAQPEPSAVGCRLCRSKP